MTQNSVFMLLCQGHHSLDNSHMEVKIGRRPTIDLQPNRSHKGKHSQNKELARNTTGHIITKGRVLLLSCQN